MKHKIGLFKNFLLLAVILISVLNSRTVFAQTNTQGLIISPFLLERQMEKGQTTDEIIDITNTSNRALPVDISVNDFFPQGLNGEPVFKNAGEGDSRFSLSSWITIKSNPKPLLNPGERTSINFSITPPLNAEDGGHYGAILFTFQNSRPEGSAVAVAQKLGAIILVKLGKAVESGEVASFKTTKSFYEYPPVDFLTIFHNTGNVHLKPRGGIVITNWFGRKADTISVNPNANNVLPQSSRQFISQWKTGFAFGHYTAEAQLVYDQTGTVVTAKTSFWVIPWKITLSVALGLFLLLFLLVWGIRLYNRWLINKVYRSSPAKKKK